MKKLWLIFAQTTTAGLALWFLLVLLKPSWLAPMAEVVTLTESAPQIGSAPAPSGYREAVRRAMPSVVNIYTSKTIVKKRRHPFLEDPLLRRFFGGQVENTEKQRASSLGSGVIISDKGYIVTNNHVVASADEIEVALADGRSASATVVGSDPETDLAVIRIELDQLPAITFGQVEGLGVGDVVLAIGNPFGVGQTVTVGIVSALGRKDLNLNPFENFIQTDAAINPGNSGGALVDASGNLIGINSAIYSRTGGSMGIGFAIPVSIVKSVMQEIISKGSVTRGWIGVETQELTAELANSFGLAKPQGVLISGVVRGGPADAAGIKPGDVLLGVNQNPIRDFSMMLALVAAQAPGSKTQLLLWRDGRELSLPVKIGKRPQIDLPSQEEEEEGE